MCVKSVPVNTRESTTKRTRKEREKSPHVAERGTEKKLGNVTANFITSTKMIRHIKSQSGKPSRSMAMNGNSKIVNVDERLMRSGNIHAKNVEKVDCI